MMKYSDSNDGLQMKLSELAEKAGVSSSTLYDYLRSGILQPAFKPGPTKSFFTKTHLQRLEEIRRLREEGVSLKEIKSRFSSSGFRSGKDDSEVTVRNAIIDKALELFAKKHYDRTRIGDITDALNIGSGTFYKYFQSKEELFLGCLQRLPVALVPPDAWEEVEAEKDFILRLKKRGYAMLNAFPVYIGILNYAKQSLNGGDQVLAAKAAECINVLITPLKKDLEIAIKEGRVRPEIDTELCAHLLLGINETFGYRRLIDPEYSIEYGFGFIEDFLKHALAVLPKAGFPSSIRCRLIDIDGGAIGMTDLQFNNGFELSGNYLNGTLNIPLTDISVIEIVKGERSVETQVHLNKGATVILKIKADDTFSGRAPVGLFSIEAGKLKQIIIEN